MLSVCARIGLLAALSIAMVGCGEKDSSNALRSPPASEMAAGDMAYAGAEPAAEEGVGPGQGGDKFDLIVENAFLSASQQPLSTFSIDVDTASYSKTRMFLLDHGRLPPPDAVRIEELVNYFTYSYVGPRDEHPFAANVEIAQCPWKPCASPGADRH